MQPKSGIWQNSDPGFLLRGSRLDQFEAWVENTDLVLTQLEQDYLEASLAERRAREELEAERLAHEANLERRSRNFLRALVAVLGVAMVVAVMLSGYAFNQRVLPRIVLQLRRHAQGMAIQEAATAVAAQEEALEMGVALSLARVACR